MTVCISIRPSRAAGGGAAVKLGYQIFANTQTYAADYVGNGLDCSNCHLDAGTPPYSAPLWGAFANYPTHRSKNHRVNSFERRLQGPSIYSENGTAPPANGEILDALSAYAFWSSRGAPVGVSLPGRGCGQETMDTLESDLANGANLYARQCAICHGESGQGTLANDGSRYQFPPLWGPDSFNWGAGMHSVDNFAAFIKHNMPLGRGGSLSDQEAWDIAARVVREGHQRPVPGDRTRRRACRLRRSSRASVTRPPGPAGAGARGFETGYRAASAGPGRKPLQRRRAGARCDTVFLLKSCRRTKSGGDRAGSERSRRTLGPYPHPVPRSVSRRRPVTA